MIAVPGDTPKFPLTTLAPVLVTVEPASTANESAVPRLMVLPWATNAQNGKAIKQL